MNDDAIKKSFLGVFPLDKIPKEAPFYPMCLIANTRPSTHKGEHWIGIYVDHEGNGTYFCSYGRQPNCEFQRCMDRLCKGWTATEKRLQAPLTATCGQYAVSYLHFRNRGLSNKKFFDLFTSDKIENDQIVTAFVNGLYDMNTKVIDVSFLNNQVAEMFK